MSTKERWSFDKGQLSEADLRNDPMEMFKVWYDHAVEQNSYEPNAVVLSTSIANKPSSRVVYLREILVEGLVFYTNYNSAKGQGIATNPNVAMNFYWRELERQVRVEGVAKRVPDELSDIYFAQRPRVSQIGAWASEQSARIDSRETLEGLYAQFEEKFSGSDVPRPQHWGGFVLEPNLFEFWQGRPGRLHDRFQFVRTEGNWEVNRLSP